MTPSYGLRADGPLITGGPVRNHARNAARECERVSGRPRGESGSRHDDDHSQHWICSLRTARSGIGQRQRVASMLRARPVKGAPNVVGTPAIVGIPLWVVAHVAVLGDVARDAGALERGRVPRGVSELVTGADGFGLSATDGGLMPPLPSSVEPSGIPARPTDEPGPIDEARGADAVADAAQAPGALAAIPPPSKSAGLDSPGIELAMPADAPVIGPPTPADAGADEAPAHGAPIRQRMARRSRAPRRMWSGSRPALRARSRPWEFQFARLAHSECQAGTSCPAPEAERRSCALAHGRSRSPREPLPSPSQSVSS